MPQDQVKAGMQGVAYTVFEGMKPEAMDVEILGVLQRHGRPEGRRHPGPPARREARIHRRCCGHERQPGLYRRQAGGRDRLSASANSPRSRSPASPRSSRCSRSTRMDKAGASARPAARRPRRESSRARPPGPAPLRRRRSQPFANLLKPIDTPLVFSGFSQDTFQCFAQALRLRRHRAGDGRRLGQQRQAA